MKNGHPFKAKAGSNGHRHPHVVRLRPGPGYQGIGPLSQGLGRQKFQLADFVTPQAKAGQIISFEPYFRPAQGLAQPLGQVERRGQGSEPEARESG
jgi:hypothetical protein